MSDERKKWWQDLDDNVFWLALWSFLGSCVTVVLCFLIYRGVHTDSIVAGLVQKGYDPQAINCLYYENSESFTCRMLVENHFKKDIANEVLHRLQQEPAKKP